MARASQEALLDAQINIREIYIRFGGRCSQLFAIFNQERN